MKPPDLTALDFLARLGVGAGLGAVIGFERQWRQRSAGLHTSSLVAIGAALFALLDTTLNAGDTTRIVAGVVTGVGFIAGGVIFRTGVNVTGLNTATTIWATAAVGALSGFGLWPQAFAGAAAIVLFNVLLQPISDAIDARAGQRHRRETIYTISAVCDSDTQPAVAAALIDDVNNSALSLQSLTRHHAQGRSVELRAQIFSAHPDDAAIERFAAGILAMPGVASTEWKSVAS